jgi:hypothetical protein
MVVIRESVGYFFYLDNFIEILFVKVDSVDELGEELGR